MPETPQAGALRTPSSSRQARCDDDMDAAPSQMPQQQPSPPPYVQEPIHDQPMNEGQTFNTTFHATQNIFDSHFNLHSGSQESDPITDLKQAFYQTYARHFYVSKYPLEAVNAKDADMAVGPFYAKRGEWPWQRYGSLLYHANPSASISGPDPRW